MLSDVNFHYLTYLHHIVPIAEVGVANYRVLDSDFCNVAKRR